MFPSQNTVIDQRYKLLEKLGEGGFAVVFKAQDVELGRTVAIKFLKVGDNDSENLQRFLREAKLIAKVNHPNVVSVYAVDFLKEENLPYIVMEYLEGESLANRVNRVGPFSLNAALSMFLPLCDALSYLHENHILHRDLSANNVFLIGASDSEIANPKIIDFGLSKSLANIENKLTATGILLGNPAYMSPEQARAEALDARSDIYSLACVFYTALYGHPPFEADNPVALLYKHQNQEPTFSKLVWKDELAAATVVGALRVALSKDPEKRFQTCAEFAAALRGEVKVSPVASVSNRKVPAILLLVAFILSLLAFKFLGLRNSGSEFNVISKNSTKKGNVSVRRSVPSTFEGLMDACDELSDNRKSEDALTLLESFKETKYLTAGQKQTILLRKLLLCAGLNQHSAEMECASKLTSDPTVALNTAVTVSLMDYFIARDPVKSIILSEKWQERHPGEECLAIELKAIRALICARKFQKADQLIRTFNEAGLKNLTIESTEFEQLKLILSCWKGEQIDPVAAVDCITETIPRDRLFNKLSNRIEAANLFEECGLNKQAISLCYAAAELCEKSDRKLAMNTLRRIFGVELYRSAYPNEVVASCKKALTLNLSCNEKEEVYDAMVTALRRLHQYSEAEKIAREAYDAFLKVFSEKQNKTDSDSRLFHLAYLDLHLILRDEMKFDEVAKFRQETLAFLNQFSDTELTKASILIQASEEACDASNDEAGIALSMQAIEHLEAVKGKFDAQVFFSNIHRVEMVALRLYQTEGGIALMEKSNKIYSRQFPEKPQFLDFLAYLSLIYFEHSRWNSLAANYDDVVRSLDAFEFEPESEVKDARSVLWLVRIYAQTTKSEDLRNELLKLNDRKHSSGTEVVLLLALCEYYLDKRQTEELKETFVRLQTKMQSLKMNDANLYDELRDSALYVLLRFPDDSASAYVKELLSGLSQNRRLEIYLEFSDSLEKFHDFSVCANFLSEHMKEFDSYYDSSLIILYSVMGDCFARELQFAQAEQSYRLGQKYCLSLIEKTKPNTDPKTAKFSTMVLWSLARTKFAQRKYSEALQAFHEFKPTPEKMKLLNHLTRQEFLVDWKQAAIECGSKDDLHEVESLEIQLTLQKLIP